MLEGSRVTISTELNARTRAAREAHVQAEGMKKDALVYGPGDTKFRAPYRITGFINEGSKFLITLQAEQGQHEFTTDPRLYRTRKA